MTYVIVHRRALDVHGHEFDESLFVESNPLADGGSLTITELF